MTTNSSTEISATKAGAAAVTLCHRRWATVRRRRASRNAATGLGGEGLSRANIIGRGVFIEGRDAHQGDLELAFNIQQRVR